MTQTKKRNAPRVNVLGGTMTKPLVQRAEPARDPIERKFPGGIAYIEPIFDKVDPRDYIAKPKSSDFRKARQTTVIVNFMEFTGNNPRTGEPMTEPRALNVEIDPSPARTDLMPKKLMKACGNDPRKVLDLFLEHPNYGEGFIAKPVPAIILEREHEALKNPEARKALQERQSEANRRRALDLREKPSRKRLPELDEPPAVASAELEDVDESYETMNGDMIIDEEIEEQELEEAEA